ncbi:hypothetical protein [Actinomadura nitritigenes]|uniref:hypothetical protein n=1 Tax=Actinomadura nitritigenes TaxID=134602 RepID=UPI003D89BE1B
MTSSQEAGSSRGRYDALRAELISAALQTERLVEASEDLLADRERFREEFRSRSFSAQISPGLGSVTVSGDGGLSIDLWHAKAAASNVARLGERILAALAEAEQEMLTAAVHGRVQ